MWNDVQDELKESVSKVVNKTLAGTKFDSNKPYVDLCELVNRYVALTFFITSSFGSARRRANITGNVSRNYNQRSYRINLSYRQVLWRRIVRFIHYLWLFGITKVMVLFFFITSFNSMTTTITTTTTTHRTLNDSMEKHVTGSGSSYLRYRCIK